MIHLRVEPHEPLIHLCVEPHVALIDLRVEPRETLVHLRVEPCEPLVHLGVDPRDGDAQVGHVGVDVFDVRLDPGDARFHRRIVGITTGGVKGRRHRRIVADASHAGIVHAAYREGGRAPRASVVRIADSPSSIESTQGSEEQL
jgi:hypothetical protein